MKELKNNEERIAYLNKKVLEESVEQEANLITDYDEALKEYKTKHNPYKIKFKGEVFEIPQSMPFSFSMFYIKTCVQRINGKDMFKMPDNETLYEIVERIFGKKFLEILNNNQDIEMGFVLENLVADILSKWGCIAGAKDKTEKNL